MRQGQRRGGATSNDEVARRFSDLGMSASPRLRTYGCDADNRRFGPIGGRTKQKPRDIGDASSLLTPRLLLLSLDEP